MKKLVLCFLNLTFILSIYSNLLAQNQRFRFVIEESFAEFDGFYYLHLDVSTQETSEVWKTKKQGEGIKVILHQGSIGNMRALRIQKWRTYKRKVTKKTIYEYHFIWEAQFTDQIGTENIITVDLSLPFWENNIVLKRKSGKSFKKITIGQFAATKVLLQTLGIRRKMVPITVFPPICQRLADTLAGSE